MAVPAWAQQSPAAEGAAADLSSEIIVTARRRNENISKVPIAITAISGEQFASSRSRSESDLQRTVPGLVIRQSGSANQFNYVIRGQSVDTYTNSPPGVLPYVNEVQIATLSAGAFYDLQGIQVLKGPQGTLFEQPQQRHDRRRGALPDHQARRRTKRLHQRPLQQVRHA